MHGASFGDAKNSSIYNERLKAIQDLEKHKEQLQKKRDKTNNYNKYVKEMYWPQVSETKRSEIESIKGALSARGGTTARSQNFSKDDIKSLKERRVTG